MNDLQDDDGAIFVDANSIMTNHENDSDDAGLNLFNSNGSLLSSSMSFGNLGADDLVDEPIGRAVGISFNPQVEMMLGNGTIKSIPLNTDGFFPSRQYESDPIDDYVDDDFSISLGNDSDNSLWAKDSQRGMESEASNVRPDQEGGVQSIGGGDVALQGMTVQGIKVSRKFDADDDDVQVPQHQAVQEPENLVRHVSSSRQTVRSHGSHVTSNAARAAK